MGARALIIDGRDTVAVALQDLDANSTVDIGGQAYTLAERIAQKHKFALQDFEAGDLVMMYGVVVGKATQRIGKGSHVGTHNLQHHTAAYDVTSRQIRWRGPNVDHWKDRTWNGYHRKGGEVGTANHWLIVPLVFCENRNLEVLRETLVEQLGYAIERKHRLDISPLVNAYRSGADKDAIAAVDLDGTAYADRTNPIFKNVDGIKFLRHDMGCGGTRQDAASLCALLAGYITHPNTAGATILSLGCQNAQMADLKTAIAQHDSAFDRPVLYFEQQQYPSERSFITSIVKETFLKLMEVNRQERMPAGLDKLVLGLECGGSDGFSGISANPALGHTSDLLVALGARTILAEFPELNGVEQELINRCTNQESAEKFAHLMQQYAERAEAVGSGFENNPSPGNIRDGLITDAIKSAGAAKKGGSSPVVDVLDYTEPAKKAGLNLLCTPGGDVESTTGLAGSGANVIVFTTGLGTPTGNAITPVLKMSTNDLLAGRMSDIIDINAGAIVTGQATVEEVGSQLLELIIATASGDYEPAAVRLGQDDFIPWKRGISL
ncbi:MAG: altronate dehydratase family protein [Saprospiraceae bacterium]|nr:altronate dehydratase family protein [Saprospiraceae bacterium]